MVLERIMQEYERAQAEQAKQEALQNATSERIARVADFMLEEQMQRIATALDVPFSSIDGNLLRFEDFYIEIEIRDAYQPAKEYQSVFEAFESNAAIDQQIMTQNKSARFPRLVGASNHKGEWAGARAFPIWQSRIGVTEEQLEERQDSAWLFETYEHDPSSVYHFRGLSFVNIPIAGIENPDYNALAKRIRAAQEATEAGKRWVRENAEHLAKLLEPAPNAPVPTEGFKRAPTMIVGFDPEEGSIDYLCNLADEVDDHIRDGYRFAGVMPKAIILIHRDYHPTVEGGILAAGDY
jgi:hypothetical protein